MSDLFSWRLENQLEDLKEENEKLNSDLIKAQIKILELEKENTQLNKEIENIMI